MTLPTLSDVRRNLVQRLQIKDFTAQSSIIWVHHAIKGKGSVALNV